MSGPGRMAGRACLIVGGTSGIGLATARRFLEEGARVAVAGRWPEQVATAQVALATVGPARAIVADVGTRGFEGPLFREAMEFLGGRLDVLFHVAGVSGRSAGDGPLHECRDEGWDLVMEINARGLFAANRAAVRQMLAQVPDDAGLRGTVLNMGSVLARSPAPEFFGTLAYAASKGAIRSLTLAAAARYAPDRIRFNLIEPGLIDTPMASRAVNDPAVCAYLVVKQPMAGGPGAAVDVAEAALYLCEPASRFVTGAILNVDGGWSVREGPSA
jgi:NAD(P)-dependent dehydrogenase (short-subunit alcohol dehydrogenase family)